MSEHNVLAGPTVDPHAQYARGVGAQVDDVPRGCRFADGLGREHIDHADSVVT